MASLLTRKLRVSLMTGDASQLFPHTNSNTLVLEGLRCSAIVLQIASQAPNMDLRIFGMKLDDMNALTVLFYKTAILNQSVLLEASSDNGEHWNRVFSGTMTEACPDFGGAPDVFFHIQAIISYFQKLSAAPPLSYKGPTDVASIVSVLAYKLGYRFESNGVEVKLNNPYKGGSYWDQLVSICQDASCDFHIDGDTLAITPMNRARKGTPDVIIGPASGLMGYPAIQRTGLEVRALYDPAFSTGGPVTVQSVIPGANGRWNPLTITHYLESESPEGTWQSVLNCLPMPT